MGKSIPFGLKKKILERCVKADKIIEKIKETFEYKYSNGLNWELFHKKYKEEISKNSYFYYARLIRRLRITDIPEEIRKLWNTLRKVIDKLKELDIEYKHMSANHNLRHHIKSNKKKTTPSLSRMKQSD